MDALVRQENMLRQALTKVSKQVRSQQRAEKRQSNVPTKMWHVATAILAMTHPDLTPACTFLEKKWEHWWSHDTTTIDKLNRWYATMQATSGFDSILHPTTSSGTRALHVAHGFMNEWNLHLWLENTNVQKAIAPSSRTMMERLHSISSQSEGSRPVRTYKSNKQRRQWLGRWRLRWNVGLGGLAARDTLPLSQCQTKVSTIQITSSEILPRLPKC